MTQLSLGPFDILRTLGRGGMGAVYEGVHQTSGAPVAIKCLISGKARDPENVEAFRTELRAVAALSHQRGQIPSGSVPGVASRSPLY